MTTLLDTHRHDPRDLDAEPCCTACCDCWLEDDGLMRTSVALRAEPIETPDQVEVLRQVRNAGAASYAHDHSQISLVRQRAWWVVMHGRLHAWLYYDADDALVGYGLVRLGSDACWWNSIGVLPAFRGRGYGAAITADVLRRHPYPVYSTVVLENTAAVHMHHTDEWEEVALDLNAGTLTLRSLPSAHERTAP